MSCPLCLCHWLGCVVRLCYAHTHTHTHRQLISTRTQSETERLKEEAQGGESLILKKARAHARRVGILDLPVLEPAYPPSLYCTTVLLFDPLDFTRKRKRRPHCLVHQFLSFATLNCQFGSLRVLGGCSCRTNLPTSLFHYRAT